MWHWWRPAVAPHADAAEAAGRIAAADAALLEVQRQAEERRRLTDRLRAAREQNNLAERIREAFGGDPR